MYAKNRPSESQSSLHREAYSMFCFEKKSNYKNQITERLEERRLEQPNQILRMLLETHPSPERIAIVER